MIRSDRNLGVNVLKTDGTFLTAKESKELNLPARENAEIPWDCVHGFNSVTIGSVSFCCSGLFSGEFPSLAANQRSLFFLYYIVQGCCNKVPRTERLKQQKFLVS